MLMLAVWAVGAGSAEAVTRTLPDDAVLWSKAHAGEQHQRGGAIAQRVLDALAAGEVAQAVDLLRSQQDPVLRESAATEVLAQLQASAPRGDVEALLDWAQAQPVKVFVQHEETRAPVYLPMFDIAQRARDVRRLWAEVDLREEWSARWQADPLAALRGLAAADDHVLQRAAEALGQLGDAAFAQGLSVLVGAPAAQVPAAIWLVVAEREPSVDALRAALQQGDPQQRLKALGLASRLSVDQAEALLGEWEADDDIGSAATLALVPRLVDADRPQAVLARLADPARRDATAAALSRAASAAKTVALLDGLHGALQGKAERDGWARLLILLDDQGQRARWDLNMEVPR
jgi:hypothetical protein